MIRWYRGRGAQTPSDRTTRKGSDMDAEQRMRDVVDDALGRLGDHMDDLDRHGPAVVRRYARSVLAGHPGSPHSKELARVCDRLVRMCVEDAAEAQALGRRVA